jgi:hypothetical protein
MSRLLNLYPAAWRERYGAELQDLLTERPPTTRDKVDLARGALDAWLHPQVLARGSQHDEDDTALRNITGAVVAFVGGGLLIASGLLINASAFDPATGYREASTAILIFFAGAVVSALAAIALATTSPTGRKAGGAMVVLALLIAAPWPLVLLGVFGYAAATIAYGIIFSRESGQPLGIPLAIAGLVLPSINLQDERALLTIPLGLAWLAIGALAVLRPVPTPTRA